MGLVADKLANARPGQVGRPLATRSPPRTHSAASHARIVSGGTAGPTPGFWQDATRPGPGGKGNRPTARGTDRLARGTDRLRGVQTAGAVHSVH